MIDRNTIVVGVQPRITQEQFKDILEAVSSPALIEAELSYKAIVAEGIDPAFCLAQFAVESAYGTVGICHDYQTRNPGNCRSSSIGVTGSITDPEKGTFVKYTYWASGFRDMAHRLTDGRFPYAQAKAKTIAQILPLWAPGADGNSPNSYVNTVISLMNRWIESNEVTPKMTLKVAVSAGHHNSDGGSALEYSITGPLCEAYYQAFKAAGVDVRSITPDGPDADTIPGDGMYPGGLQAVAQKVVDWSNQGWTADLFLECHTQAGPRGVFAIYPDWGSDLDTTVKNSLGQKMVRAISAASGIPVWSNGLMSEKSTGVGLDGYRLGIFLRTAPVANKTTRLIIEHGAHTDKQDLAILQTPGMLDKIAAAGVKAAIEHFGGGVVPTEPKTDVRVFPTGKFLAHGFKTFYDRLAAAGPNLELLTLGFPVTDEFDCPLDGKTNTIQLFERGGLMYESTNAQPWDIHTLTTSQLVQALEVAKTKSLLN